MINFNSLPGTALGLPTVVALGLFDGVHLGHGQVMKDALEACHEGVASCLFTFTMEGRRPKNKEGGGRLLSEEIRREIVEEMGFDYMVSPPFEDFCALSPEEFVSGVLVAKLRAAAVCCGEDFRFGAGATGTVDTLRELCAAHGIALLVTRPVLWKGERISSTRIREAVANGDIRQANAMLGRPFTIDFPVVHGMQLGRRLHFPTINQLYDPEFVLPRFGVYSSYTTIDGIRFASVTNVGVRPTVSQDSRPVAETHLIQFSGNLYGKRAKVSFLAFMRPEMKFSDTEALKNQVYSDIGRAGEVFADLGSEYK